MTVFSFYPHVRELRVRAGSLLLTRTPSWGPHLYYLLASLATITIKASTYDFWGDTNMQFIILHPSYLEHSKLRHNAGSVRLATPSRLSSPDWWLLRGQTLSPDMLLSQLQSPFWTEYPFRMKWPVGSYRMDQIHRPVCTLGFRKVTAFLNPNVSN